MEERGNEFGGLEAEWTSDESAHVALARYREQRMKESVMGPIVSGVIHVSLLLLLSIFVVAQERPPEVVVEIVTSDPIPPVDPVKPDPPDPIQTEDPQISPIINPVIAQAVEAEAPSEQAEEPADEMESADNLDFEEVLDVINRPTMCGVTHPYGARGPIGRKKAVIGCGGTPNGQDAVLRSLRWLASVQLEDGSWEGLPAQSGLALLCFLAHGDTPLSEEFGGTVQRAIQWLATNMPEGRPWGKGDSHVAYAHGIATYALAEAYGMTQIPFLAEPVENGIAVIVNGQQVGGGFDYNYKKGARWDLSVTGWQMQAMKAAYLAGCTNPGLPDAIKRSVEFTKTTAAISGADSSKLAAFGYTQPGKESGSASMTGVGTVGLQLLGAGATPEAQAGARSVAVRKTPIWERAASDWSATAAKHLYGWYYDTQAMFQHFSSKAPEWRRWNQQFQTVLIRNQHSSGYWTHQEHHTMGGERLSGKVLSTTFCCLQLEVYYRHLKTSAFSPDRVAKATIGLGEGQGSLSIQ